MLEKILAWVTDILGRVFGYFTGYLHGKAAEKAKLLEMAETVNRQNQKKIQQKVVEIHSKWDRIRDDAKLRDQSTEPVVILPDGKSELRPDRG